MFADVSLRIHKITYMSIEKVLTDQTKAIVCVHLAGWPCDMSPIMDIAEKHNLFVIEDCAQAHGAKYKGRSVGSIGRIGAWSFCQDKIMTTGGEGGWLRQMIVNCGLACGRIKIMGKVGNAVYEREHPQGFRWVHESFGTNWRMTEMQGAIGRVQLKHLSDWNAKRLANANEIWRVARDLKGLRVPKLTCFGCEGDCNYTNGCVHALINAMFL